jgi:two-component system cell cycle sensor histidine kinase/response regulator CckA
MLSDSALTKEWLKDRLALEEAVSEISRILLTSDRMDLKDVLSIIGKSASVNRTSIIVYNEVSGEVKSTHEWICSDNKLKRSNIKKQTLKFHQWVYTGLKSDEIIMIPDIKALPSEAYIEKGIQNSGQFRSLLVIPIYSNAKLLIGAIAFENFMEPREWLGEEVQTFRVISEMISAHWERRKAINALERSEKKYRELYRESKKAEEVYRSLINSSADAIVISDLKGITKYVSPSFTSLFGWGMDEVKEKEIPFIPKHEITPHEAMIKEIVEAGNNCQGFETERYTKDGRVLDVSLSVSRFYDHNGISAGVLYVLRDISEKKKLEAQLLQAQKMEAIGILAGGIAHDFNNNLQAIFGCTEVLLIDKNKDHPDYSKLVTIEKSIQRASDLTKRLLIFGRKMENEFEPVDLNNEIMQVSEILNRTIPKMINIESSVDKNIKLINADPGQLEQVLMNLGINARDAMPEGGTLEFRTEMVVLKADFCDINPGLKPGEYIRLTISDDGHGMDEYTLKHIYEPFFSTKKKGEGTGLGLSMVYGIVKGHGGYITCFSEPEKGTTFEIYFPVIDDYTTTIQDQEKIPDFKGKNETILFVEDDEINRQVGKELLTEYGYNVITAPDCESAFEYFQKNSGEIELIISDLIMPGIGGKKLLENILQIDPEAKVIIASGYNAAESAQMVKEWGAKDFISKPYEMNRMLRAVRNVLNQAAVTN